MEHDHSVLGDGLDAFFSQSGFMPHGHCYLWKPALVWTHFLSDMLIGGAYVAISFLLYALVKKIRLPFGPIFIAFGVFIGACGLTHFMEVWTLWNPDYWLAGGIKAVTAVASVATGFALHRLGPKVMEFANSARLSEERQVKLTSAHAELETLYEKVKEADVLKTQFFANVSHELRTPLSLILGPIEDVMREGNLSPTQQQKLDVVARNSKTLLKQVNDLLDISKLEAGRMKLSYTKSDLVKLFRFIAAHFETAMQSRNIFFSVQCPASVPAEIDPEKIQRVFMNLLSNAIKFVPDGGRVRAIIESEGEEVAFTISDTGPGVEPALRGVIFERFRQGEGGANRKVGGTGLGLAIVKEFVEMHGGSVKLLNGHTPCATFVIRLPLKAPAGTSVAPELQLSDESSAVLAGAVEEVRPQPLEKAPQLQMSGRPTVLICEDNPDMNRFVAETLAADFNVIRALDGREGLEKARALRPDLIVSDIMMPNLSGDQLVREIKKDESLQDIPILLLSARADDEMRVRLLKEGASDYVVKPFASEELKARSWNLLSLKKTRDILTQEVAVKSKDLVSLAEALASRKREAELAFEVAKVARDEAERASEVKGAFLSLVSHELNTPLMAMNLTIQLLQRREREKLNPKQMELIDRLAGSSKQLRSLIEGLLEYVRIGRTGDSHIEPIDLQKMTHETIEEFQTMAKGKGLELRTKVDGRLAPLLSDPLKIKVIINNLIVNALKFTEQGFVEVEAKATPTGTSIIVRDTGPGIPKEDQARIFEPFERLEPLERKSIPGIGLGLALVKQLVEALGGQIRIESEEGNGSAFILEFPAPLTSV